MGELWVTIRWNKETEQWRMLDAKTGRAIQEFFDCKTFNKVFENQDKSIPQNWHITTTIVKPKVRWFKWFQTRRKIKQ